MNSRQRFLRKIKFVFHVFQARVKRKSCPLYVGLSINSRCNLSCSFCFARYYDKKTPDIPRRDLEGLIDHLARNGTAYMNISGGEPLLHPDIEAILRRSLSRGIMTSITTNGTLIHKHLEVLSELDFVCVSVDGDKNSHDRVRGEGTHQIIMKNIRLLRDRNIPVMVTCLLNMYNKKNLRWIFEQGKLLGFTVKLHIPNEETELGPSNPDVAVTDEEIRKALSQVIEWQKEGLPVDFSSSTYRYALKWPRSHWNPIFYQGEKFPTPPWPCYASYFWCQIDSDGKVYPCCAMFKNFEALDFRKVGFDRAFAHTRNRNCVTCAYLSNNEFNQIIGLRPRVFIENALRSIPLFQKK